MNNAVVLRPFFKPPFAAPRKGMASATVHPFLPVRTGVPSALTPSFETDVINGLSQPQKAIPSTWLYDHRGSELFEEITHLDEYYPTRNETQLLRACAGAIAEAAGPRAVVIELGSGSSRKTRLLLGALDTPQAYLPIDISAQFLEESVADLTSLFAGLRVIPVVGDFTRIESLPELRLLRAWGGDAGRNVVFFPGSTRNRIATLRQPDRLPRRCGSSLMSSLNAQPSLLRSRNCFASLPNSPTCQGRHLKVVMLRSRRRQAPLL